MKRLITICLVSVLLTAAVQANGTVSVNVTSYPLWTDTTLSLNNGDIVQISASGHWTWGEGYWCGPDGDSNSFAQSLIADDFYSGALTGALIAYVGVDPYQGQWRNGSFFPQASGYWDIGSSAQFTGPSSGELWFGFNDDAVWGDVYDNVGTVTAQISVNPTPEPATICLLGLGALSLIHKKIKEVNKKVDWTP